LNRCRRCSQPDDPLNNGGRCRRRSSRFGHGEAPEVAS
jgi:hypothetical protein